jgi:hypothetical protein
MMDEVLFGLCPNVLFVGVKASSCQRSRKAVQSTTSQECEEKIPNAGIRPEKSISNVGGRLQTRSWWIEKGL